MLGNQSQLFEAFPNLNSSNCFITSPRNEHYNCIAWAAKSTSEWWWPAKGCFWPSSVPRQNTVAAYISVFATLGYEKCQNGDLEKDYEKVAIFVQDGTPKHMARQLENGWWTSKLGALEDIVHRTVGDVSGSLYGIPVQFMRRAKSTQ